MDTKHDVAIQRTQSLFLTWAIVCALAALVAMNGCRYPELPQNWSVQGTQLTSHGQARMPQMAWTGSKFGLTFVAPYPSNQAGDIYYMEVDKVGAVLKTPKRIIGIPFDPGMGFLNIVSDLAYNSTDQQFAFVYAHGKKLWFKRLDADGNQWFPFIKLHFPGLQDHNHPHMTDLAIVWNGVLQEYGITFVTREDPYDETRHNDIYLARIKADGTFVTQYHLYHAINCPGDCWKTALTCSKQTGKYAVAYYKHESNPSRVEAKVAFIDQNYGVSEHTVFQGRNFMGARPIKIHYDPRSGNFLVAATTYSKSMITQVVTSAGVTTSEISRSSNNAFGYIYSMVNVTSSANSFLMGASLSDAIIGWHFTDTQHHAANVISSPSDNKDRGYPCLRAAGRSLCMSWIENGNLFFAKING